ncbi:MAG: 5'/3'-nucleotidase SurE [Hoeflea sp.]|uniref:5'/3'-nucleotidase SurE n=1 Tax=Hoeflea sp. TaxID=1940281 RepID=UPI001DAD58C8|nr:5'/3'-nucleotidase SurE [Hoeflea sp.]MBU4530707.1 5'/3'-nucleotidase SurE [Alphaproteobacteria bacterium]MBU4544927.1 5'/3'-nucleotidase SurE [Alphaproteobacteria bacterium]MBU4552070.1 5'/3'-nucleotidase SurE [Alphaproteobacteria bacterium]MBV1722259.1 5'/3'-nucleotidase SurE [Hoeflea sp.]MBV1761821.1 5'/3'-nucleotidase SurE [Hoeflea sp.]
MRILITNDDGIHAEGLEVLERIARTLSDDVWIVAPETDQSGLAHSLTLSEPLRLRKVRDKTYALRGTPTDCVIMAVRSLMDPGPDLVLSGVNSGQNVADDVTYSGTVAGAMEGTLLGVRSIAMSQAYNWSDGRIVPWVVAETLAPALLKKLVAIDLPQGTLLNVNFPNCAADEVKGVVVTDQGQLTHALSIEERQDGRGFPYFWLKFGRRDFSPEANSDIKAISNGYISVTPLKLDLTNHAVQEKLAAALED